MVSILKRSTANSLYIQPTTTALSTINGAPLKIHGKTNASITIQSLRRSYSYDFFVADVNDNIIGLDFLHHHNMSINCDSLALLDNNTGLKTLSQKPNSNPNYISVKALTKDFLSINDDSLRFRHFR